MKTIERRLVDALAGGLPRERYPYAALAQRLGEERDDVLAALRSMLGDGRLRRMAAVVDQRRVGVSGNVLVAWDLPEQRLDEVGRRLAARAEITHAYVRPAGPEWPYRLYTMVHAADLASCERLVARWAAELDAPRYVLLPTRREWKKSAPVYRLSESRDAEDCG